MTDNQESVAWPPALSTLEQQKACQASLRHQLLIAQAYSAEIIMKHPDLRDNQLAQAVNQKTGLGMDLARVALF